MAFGLTDSTPEVAALEWLRFKRQCQITALERWVFADTIQGRPDVCGVTKQRYMLEVEIKRTWSDFKADAKKWKNHAIPATRQRYYLADASLAERISVDIAARKPKYDWGVLMLTGVQERSGYTPMCRVLRKCRPNPAAKQLVNSQLWAMIAKMSSTMVVLQDTIRRHERDT